MNSRACLDAGPISLYYQKNPPEKVELLIQEIKSKKISAFVPNVILIEVYKHLCIAKGKSYAENCIRSFQHNIPIQLIPLTPELILEAGYFKCQYRSKLSYNDTIVIATALKNKAILHTTEKDLPKIRHLRIETYKF